MRKYVPVRFATLCDIIKGLGHLQAGDAEGLFHSYVGMYSP